MRSFEEVVSNLSDIRAEAEEVRNKELGGLKKKGIIYGVIAVFICLGLGLFLQSIYPALFTLIFALTGFGFFIYKPHYDAYQRVFKPILHRMLEYMLEKEVRYTQNGSVNMDDFNHSEVIEQHLGGMDRFKSEDTFESTYLDVPFIFSEVKAEEHYRDNENKSRYRTVFDGILFESLFNKEFKGVTVVRDNGKKLPKSGGNWFSLLMVLLVFGVFASVFGSIFIFTGSEISFEGAKGLWIPIVVSLVLFFVFGKRKRQKVHLENVEFNEVFNVYADSQIESRYILSTSLMEKIYNMRENMGRKVNLTFKENRLYIGMEFEGEDLFEGRLNKPLTEQDLKVEYEFFSNLIGIIEELELNVDIWKV
ncbi:DUF3137 domain-containing protein (plasmid) [Pontibacillus sp. ALD_SL1]|uniref:DUF3137 domain-containing protein n=1 Tax=Pontibacillus sp. ALD_SL1 TaxID=2777185 RepID=UPI001A96DA7F|nr:DUF3137 domain-containing protein [Pontibacillus sp. ALD_SL1]QST02377.1 DUF3137 domain-containing protein [Pontibacillus sp. ALD_SL1]